MCGIVGALHGGRMENQEWIGTYMRTHTTPCKRFVLYTAQRFGNGYRQGYPDAKYAVLDNNTNRFVKVEKLAWADQLVAFRRTGVQAGDWFGNALEYADIVWEKVVTSNTEDV